MGPNWNDSHSSVDIHRVDEEMTELFLLLPSRQASLLERAARQCGLTSGGLIRSLIRDFFRTQTWNA